MVSDFDPRCYRAAALRRDRRVPFGKRDLIAILMIRSPAARLPYRYLMRELVYQAVID